MQQCERTLDKSVMTHTYTQLAEIPTGARQRGTRGGSNTTKRGGRLMWRHQTDAWVVRLLCHISLAEIHDMEHLTRWEGLVLQRPRYEHQEAREHLPDEPCCVSVSP